MTAEELQIKALLADSGEGELAGEERLLTAAWSRDVARIAALARAAFATPAPDAAGWPWLRHEGARALVRRRRRLVLCRLAEAATLLILAWNGWSTLSARRQRADLERLDNVLALLETGPGARQADGVSIANLSQRLIRLQTATW
jgi:hypothetical protein